MHGNCNIAALAQSYLRPAHSGCIWLHAHSSTCLAALLLIQGRYNPASSWLHSVLLLKKHVFALISDAAY